MHLYSAITRKQFERIRTRLDWSISGRVDRASATETVDLGSIPGRVKPKTIKIGIHSFPAWRSAITGTVWSFHRVWYTYGQVAAWLEDRKVPSLSPGQGNLVNKM